MMGLLLVKMLLHTKQICTHTHTHTIWEKCVLIGEGVGHIMSHQLLHGIRILAAERDVTSKAIPSLWLRIGLEVPSLVVF